MSDRDGDYTYDPKSRRFRGPDGRYVSAATVRGLREQIVSAKSARTATLVNQLYDGAISPGRFVLSMREELKRTMLMQYMLGRGGVNSMTQADYGRVGSMLKPQYARLNRFTEEIMAGGISRDSAIYRAGLYMDATRFAHERGKSAAWDVALPAYPGLHPNCACDWDIRKVGDDVHAYWKTRSKNPCPDCEANESEYNPYVIQGVA